MTQYRASIDIGSNSILLLVAKLEGDKISVLESHSEVTGLGRLLDKNGKFLNESMDATFHALVNFINICGKYGIAADKILATATEAARVSSNATEFFQKIKSQLTLTVKIISGEAEAYFSAQGILFDKEIKDSLPTVMDIGGASTEIIRVDARSQKLLNSFSMPMGSVRFTNWKEDGVLPHKISEIKNKFSLNLESVKTDYLHCVAGTMTSIGNMCLGNKDFVEDEVHGLELTVEQITELRARTVGFSPEQFLKDYPFLGKRSMSINGGLDLALTVFDWLGVHKVRISTYGLRYGTLLAGAIADEFTVGK